MTSTAKMGGPRQGAEQARTASESDAGLAVGDREAEREAELERRAVAPASPGPAVDALAEQQRRAEATASTNPSPPPSRVYPGQAQPPSVAVQERQPGTKVVDGETYLDVKRGDRVRLLLPIWDGVQRIPENTEIVWPHDDPPLAATAALPGWRNTNLDAPVYVSGIPPADYIDPTTGEKPVLER